MNFTWMYTFKSLEGEAHFAGLPTAYIRFAKCNFTCGMFNNPERDVDEKGYAALTFDPTKITSLNDIDPIDVGCDTQYAVNPKFSHLWKKGTEDDLANELMALLPNNSWTHPVTKLKTMLSLTGGEPTMNWKKIPTLLSHPKFDEVETVLIETNCAVPFKPQFIDELNDWIAKGTNRRIVWSNSPKLSPSGEKWEAAIVPNIAKMQADVSSHMQYFKFVCGPRESDFDEVDKAMEEYYAAGISRDVGVYIMPESCTEEQQINIAADVADMCFIRGRIYCHRVHNSVYANAIGK